MPRTVEVVGGRSNQVYTWGSGFMGQLGHGDRSSFEWPRAVQALDGIGITQLAAGPGDHIVGLTGVARTSNCLVFATHHTDKHRDGGRVCVGQWGVWSAGPRPPPQRDTAVPGAALLAVAVLLQPQPS
jgi:hypothetical protein